MDKRAGGNEAAQVCGNTAVSPKTRRSVAVTFDDLPLQPPIRDPALIRAITEKLLQSLAGHGVRAVGFVNEGSLYRAGRPDGTLTAVLKMWLDAGHEVGNHTFSHLDLNDAPADLFCDDILRGEVITRELLKRQGRAPSYFRHPYLHTGASLETRRAVESFLARNGYSIAPVTVHSQEWMFSQVYDKAREEGDEPMMRRVAEAYVPYMEDVFEFIEGVSAELFGYEIRQVLLLHASGLNADHAHDLLGMLKRRGYEFVPLSEALEDGAYGRPESYAGPVGWSWLHRWAFAEGRRLKVSPREPEFVNGLFDEMERLARDGGP